MLLSTVFGNSVDRCILNTRFLSVLHLLRVDHVTDVPFDCGLGCSRTEEKGSNVFHSVYGLWFADFTGCYSSDAFEFRYNIDRSHSRSGAGTCLVNESVMITGFYCVRGKSPDLSISSLINARSR